MKRRDREKKATQKEEYLNTSQLRVIILAVRERADQLPGEKTDKQQCGRVEACASCETNQPSTSAQQSP